MIRPLWAIQSAPGRRAGDVVEHRLSDFYDEALQALETAHLAFPVQFFKAAAIRAFVAESRGDQQLAARRATEALEAAAREQSPFRYHRSLGLLGDAYPPVIARLTRLAAAERSRWAEGERSDDFTPGSRFHS